MTSPLGFPYPNLGSVANIAEDIQALAESVNNHLADGFLFSGRVVFGGFTTPAGNYNFILDDYPKLRAIRVYGVGGGGKGGNAGATNSGQRSEGSGGGGGAYCESFLLRSALPSIVPITVGAGASGSSGGNGADGGNTTFGSFWTAGGGKGGLFMPATSSFSSVSGGDGGTATGGNFLNHPGQRGGPGIILMAGGDGSHVRFIAQNHGGASLIGLPAITTADGTTRGEPGVGPGGGSSGARNSTSGPVQGSFAGRAGYVVIEIYI